MDTDAPPAAPAPNSAAPQAGAVSDLISYLRNTSRSPTADMLPHHSRNTAADIAEELLQEVSTPTAMMMTVLMSHADVAVVKCHGS